MSDVAIKIEGIGKKYRLGQRGASYATLRDNISTLFNSSLKRQKEEEKELWALNDINLEIKRGEVVGVIGRNGAGKSTLLKILSRITEPTKGKIELNGRVGSLLEVGTGFHPELTGRENIFLNGSIIGMRKKEIESKFDDIVEFAEIEKFIDTPVKHYSSGMYVRLAFAVAAHLEPEVLLVDEVLAVGDVQFQQKCLGKMHDVAGQGRTVLFVSHNMAAVRALCSRGVYLDSGFVLTDALVDDAIDVYLRGKKVSKSLALEEKRSGNGKIRYEKITINRGKGECVEEIASGDDVVFSASVRVYESNLKNVIFSFGIKDELGNYLLLLRSNFTNNYYSELSGVIDIVCTVPDFPLIGGKYLIDVYAESKGETLDFVESAADINVVDGDFYGTGQLKQKNCGPFLVKQTWGRR